ncbi:MAG: methyltransferase [Erythrobacter sp.]|uniref:class I SAM-dependent methyltransferase n=1 Tax=Erythrobacter sp. TaxID=1042 RepID=UPI003266A7B1
MRTFVVAAISALALTACDAGAGSSLSSEESSTELSAEKIAADLNDELAHERRAEDTARDAWRNPAETLGFFQVAPSHTVIEYAPGGGWYTRIIAPYLAENGQYVGVGFAPEAAASLGDEFVERVRAGGESFSETQSEALGIPTEKLPFYFGNAIPDELAGTVDRVLMIRMMHNLLRWGIADSETEALFAALKPGGMLGVVQHRAKPDAPEEYVDGNKGYLKEAELIAYFEGKGFELVGTSEINANPADTADYEAGVWTLPPSLRSGDENQEAYEAIGESDRMTLLFKKPA